MCSSDRVERDIFEDRNICYNNYTSDQQHAAVVSCRFFFGFLMPFLIIIICYVVIIQKLKLNQSARSKKPFKIMTALIATFLICWLPFHTVALMEVHHHKYASILPIGQVIGATFASANSCLNPFLYAFMGTDIKKTCYALLTKIENATEEGEEDPATRCETPFTPSVK